MEEQAEFVNDALAVIVAFWAMHLGGYLLLRRDAGQQQVAVRRLLEVAAEVFAGG